MKHFVRAFFALVSMVAYSTEAQQGPPPTAFVHVDVVPMDRETVLEDRTVIVRDGRIATVGPATEVEVPAEAERIDGTGRYLMPGLADMHVHVWEEDHLELLLLHGVTTVRNLWGAPVHLQWQEEIEAGTRVAPSIYTAGPILDGPASRSPWNMKQVATAAEAAAEVRRQHAAGYQGVKVYDSLSPEVYEAIVETAAEVGLPVWGHVPDAVGLESVLRPASVLSSISTTTSIPPSPPTRLSNGSCSSSTCRKGWIGTARSAHGFDRARSS